MTRSDAELDIGGTGSVLAIWSILIVVIGAALFIYSMVVTFRGRRNRRRRRRPAGPPSGAHGPNVPPVHQGPPRQPGPVGRPMPPPPASRPLPLPSGPTVGGVPVGRHLGLPRPPAALPPGPHSRPLALPGPPTQRFPSAPPPVGLPIAGSPPALPPGPAPALAAGPSALPPGPLALPSGPATQEGVTYTAATYGTAVAADPSRPTRTEPPAEHKAAKAKRGRPDPCATLRAECEALRELASAAAAAAAQAATDAESAHADFVSAQRTADEARRAIEEVVREATDVANQVAQLERAHTGGQEKLQAETSHAAFAAYRRGDISAEQLREVFKRAEGWTPEHDRLSRRSNELRAQETELIRIRDAAILAEQMAGDHARTTAITARTLDEEARTAAVDARGRCAAADACEQRGRRR